MATDYGLIPYVPFHLPVQVWISMMGIDKCVCAWPKVAPKIFFLLKDSQRIAPT